MLTVVLGELALLAILALVFIGLHARGWRRTSAGRQLMVMAVVVLAEAVALLALGADWDPPLWVFAAVFGAADLMMAGWLALLWRARRDRREGEGS